MVRATTKRHARLVAFVSRILDEHLIELTLAKPTAQTLEHFAPIIQARLHGCAWNGIRPMRKRVRSERTPRYSARELLHQRVRCMIYGRGLDGAFDCVCIPMVG